MIVAIVDFHVKAEDQQKALDVLLSEARGVRANSENLTYRPHSNPEDPTHVGVVHEWQSETGFAAYLASDGFKRMGEVLFPLMTQPPSSRRYTAEPIA